MRRALDQLSKSPFMCHIEGATLPRRFQQPTFTIYNGKTNPMEYVSQFNQRMAIHSKDEVLMCKVFPSSLGPVAMRWFNGLKTNSIDSYRQLTQAFGSHFVTNIRTPQPLSALVSLSMHNGETLKAYLDRHWEMYNEMDGNFDDVAISTFKNNLPAKHGLRKSLISKLVTSERQLMKWIDKYKRVEKDQLQGKGKEKVIPQERRDFSGHHGQTHQEPQRDTTLGPPVGTINVILAALGRMGMRPSRVLSVAQLPAEVSKPESKRARMKSHPILSFSEEEKIGTTQPHDDVLVITLRIGDYDVKRVMVDDGSGAEVMYPDLYKGLRLKPEDLIPYSSPLISFDGKLVIPKGMIRLPIQTGPEIVEVNFIVVDTYSPPYRAIVGRP
nr:hypothetical protein CFP56_15489 [Quercus suber]